MPAKRQERGERDNVLGSRGVQFQSGSLYVRPSLVRQGDGGGQGCLPGGDELIDDDLILLKPGVSDLSDHIISVSSPTVVENGCNREEDRPFPSP